MVITEIRKKSTTIQKQIIFVLVLCVCLGNELKAQDIYKDPNASIEDRVEDLLSKMTIEEKVGQLLSWNDTRGAHFNENCATDSVVQGAVKRGIGNIQPIIVEVTRDAAVKNSIQKYVIENSRLGIPVYFVAEALHGLCMFGATSFPQAIAQASSWDTVLVRQIARQAAMEARARGHQMVLSPVVDIARDPRWGRTEETYGEDTYLSARMGIASVTGFQGTHTGEIGPLHVAATLKHFAGHSIPESGVNKGPSEIGERSLRQYHLEVFRQIIEEARPKAVMPSYGSLDGLPPHANRWLLRDVLREEWGFDGMVVSDWGGINYLHEYHYMTEDRSGSALKALIAGVDVDQPQGKSYPALVELVTRDRTLETLLDESVRRVLRFKFEMGLFENPYLDEEEVKRYYNTPEARELAYEAAAKGMVLLKNSDHILPLNVNKYKSIAVIGAHADNMILGGYSGVPPYKTTLLSGLKKKLEGQAKVHYAKGFEIYSNYPENSFEAWYVGKPVLPTAEREEQLYEDALRVAKNSDLVIMCLGEDEMITHETSQIVRPGDHASLDVRENQLRLFREIKKMGKPVVVYLMNGRPLSINELEKEADAILEGWYAGQEGGNVAADILFGDINPSGKLPITFSKSVGQIPIYYNQKPTRQRFNYVELDNKPLYPFGYGLSYTTFQYDNLTLSEDTLSIDGNIKASITIRNTGDRDGTEIVQLYIRDKVSSIERAIIELKDFARIDLKPGESKTIAFNIDKSKLEFWSINNCFEAEQGEFELMIGASSADIRQKALFWLK